MSRTAAPAAKQPKDSPPGSAAGADILTLREAASYLRLDEPEVVRLVHEQGLPGRHIGSEWRFLKAALQAWLSLPQLGSRKQAVLALVGKFKDDPFLDSIVEEAYRQRGRPIMEEED